MEEKVKKKKDAARKRLYVLNEAREVKEPGRGSISKGGKLRLKLISFCLFDRSSTVARWFYFFIFYINKIFPISLYSFRIYVRGTLCRCVEKNRSIIFVLVDFARLSYRDLEILAILFLNKNFFEVLT